MLTFLTAKDIFSLYSANLTVGIQYSEVCRRISIQTESHPDAVSGSGIIQLGHINTEAVSQPGSVWMHHEHPVSLHRKSQHNEIY